MPTDRGCQLLKPPALHAEQTSAMPVTGPPNLGESALEISWSAVGVGLHLTVLAFAGMVAVVSLAALRWLLALRQDGPRSAGINPGLKYICN
jgi:hypothetical protein